MSRLIGYFFGIGTTLALLVGAAVAVYISHLAKDLPDYEVLAKYEPPVTTRIHASDGALMAEYARERRLYLPIQAVPDRVKAAFLSAEDKNFYNHPGIDITGLGRAIWSICRMGPGRRQVGASTITQQVAKNFLLSSDQTYERKIKEMILAFRIEQAYSKDRILELYLNEIFFGFGAYGVAGAALTYFDKSVNELTVAEAAYLASLPKGPNNYHPFNMPTARSSAAWVIDQMVANGYVTQEGAKAKARLPGATPRRTAAIHRGEYFTESASPDHRARGGMLLRWAAFPSARSIPMQLIAQGGAERPAEVRQLRGTAPATTRRLRRLGCPAGPSRAGGCPNGARCRADSPRRPVNRSAARASSGDIVRSVTAPLARNTWPCHAGLSTAPSGQVAGRSAKAGRRYFVQKNDGAQAPPACRSEWRAACCHGPSHRSCNSLGRWLLLPVELTPQASGSLGVVRRRPPGGAGQWHTHRTWTGRSPPERHDLDAKELAAGRRGPRPYIGIGSRATR
jgi:hypothetical protein